MNRAKELFKEYNGSRYQMERAEVIEEYLTYQISRETEEQWAAEMIRQFAASGAGGQQYVYSYCYMCTMAANFKNKENILRLIGCVIEKNGLDDVSRLFMINYLSSLAKKMIKKGGERAAAVRALRQPVIDWLDATVCKVKMECLNRHRDFASVEFSDADVTLDYIKQYKAIWEGL